MSVFLWGLLLGVNYIVSIFFYHVQHKSLTQYNGQQIPRPLIYYWEQKFGVRDFGLISKIIFKLGIRQFSPKKTGRLGYLNLKIKGPYGHMCSIINLSVDKNFFYFLHILYDQNKNKNF